MSRIKGEFMKVFILVDEKNIVRCVASDECNLHKDKLHMTKYQVELEGFIGDEYKDGKWKAKPENYVQPTEKQLEEKLINERIREIAIRELKAEGKL